MSAVTVDMPGQAPSGKRKHLIDSLVSAGAGSGVYALSIITGPILARALGADGRGDLASVLVPMQLLAWILALGLPLACAYYARSHPRRTLLATAYVQAFAVGVPIAIMVWFAAPAYLSGHDPVTVTWMRIALVLGFAATPSWAAVELLRATRGAGVAYNLLMAIGPVTNFLALTVLFVLGELDLQAALASGVLSMFLQAIVILVWLRAVPSVRIDRQVAKLQVAYGLRSALGDTSGLLVARLDQVIMVAMVSPSELGIYAVAVTASTISTPLAQGIGVALFPHLLSGSKEERAQRIRSGTIWTMSVSVTAVAALALAAPWLLPFAFGEEFRAAVVPLWLLLPGQLCLNLSTVRIPVFQAHGKPGLASVATLVAAGLTVVLVVPVISAWGVEGAAALTSLAQAGQLAALILLGRRLKRQVAGTD